MKFMIIKLIEELRKRLSEKYNHTLTLMECYFNMSISDYIKLNIYNPMSNLN